MFLRTKFEVFKGKKSFPLFLPTKNPMLAPP